MRREIVQKVSCGFIYLQLKAGKVTEATEVDHVQFVTVVQDDCN